MVDLDTEIKPLNNAPNGLCKENLDNFQQFIKIAEGASDNARKLLISKCKKSLKFLLYYFGAKCIPTFLYFLKSFCTLYFNCRNIF